MAEEFQLGSGNWWESSSSSSRLNHRFESSSGSSSSSTAAITSTQNDVSMENSGFIGCWPTHLVVDSKPKSSLDSVSAAGGGGDDAALLSHHGFHNIMGLGLSPQPIPCWNNNNPSLFSSNANANASFQQDCSSSYDYDKQMNRLSLDQPQPTPPLSLEGSTASSDLDRTASAVLQPESPPMNFSYDISQNYGMKPGAAVAVGDITSPTWSKFPQFLRPKQPQFSNNTTFWNAAMNDDDAQFSLFPVDEKPKNISDSSTATKKTAGCTETSSKRPRDQNDTATPMPAFKVRKEKMGDRITALQQLISPFGKTDTASVLSEAIEYIKFLHDQVNVLSTPYLKSGASMRHQLNFEKSKVNPGTASGQDLRSRGLCLVPISSTMTFPLTPTFGGCFR